VVRGFYIFDFGKEKPTGKIIIVKPFPQVN
jgi:hypothetical protein